MIEVTKFHLADGVRDDDFLEKNAEFQQDFIYQQQGLVRRTVASGLDGEWVVLTWWQSMKDARASAAAALDAPVAREFASLVDAPTLTTQYFKELPG